jgi:hypothetical protein
MQRVSNVSLRDHIPASGQKKPPTETLVGGALLISA